MRSKAIQVFECGLKLLLFRNAARTDSLAACVIRDFHFWPSQEIDERLITTLGHMLIVRPGQVVSSISKVKLSALKSTEIVMKLCSPLIEGQFNPVQVEVVPSRNIKRWC